MCIYTLYTTPVKQRDVLSPRSHRENPLAFTCSWRQLSQTLCEVRICCTKGESLWARAEGSLDLKSEFQDGDNEREASPPSCLCVRVIVWTWMHVIILSVSVCNGALTQTHASCSALWVGFYLFIYFFKENQAIFFFLPILRDEAVYRCRILF